MSLRRALAAVVLATGLAGLAQAVPPGFSLIFDGQGEGEVVFEGEVHSGTGMYCADCHMSVFDVSRASQITRRDHNREIYCFTCHNGEIAFAPRRNCTTCHADVEED
jgi:c(7)-type cytochrome triheme protein